MKKSQKYLNQHLKDEYYDNYIEPYEGDIERLSLDNLLKRFPAQQDNKQNLSQACNENHIDNISKKSTQALKPNNTVSLAKLSIEMLQDLATQLSKDAQECINHILEIRPMEDYQLLETYYSLHKEFQTVPFLFYSHTPNRTVYIWQINRLCPFKQGSNSLMVDSRAFGSQKSLHISLLLLAKIVGEDNESIVGVDILDDTQLLIKIKSENTIILKLYDIKNFVPIAKVNPFKQEVLASRLYTYKLIMREAKSPENTVSGIEVSMWRRKTVEDIDYQKNVNLQTEQINQNVLEEKEVLIKRQICDGEFNPKLTSVAYKADNGVIIIVYNLISRIMGWRDDELVSVRFDGAKTDSFSQAQNSVFLLELDEDGMWSLFEDEDSQKPFQEICFASFPAIGIRNKSEWDSDEVKNMRANAEALRKERIKTKEALFNRESSYDNNILVYNTSVSLTNPNMGKSDIIKRKSNSDEEEEKEISLIEKVAKAVNHVKQPKSDVTELQQHKEILKQIRADIKTRKTEIKKFDDEHGEHYSKKNYKRPDEVPKEVMELYAQQKLEKNKLVREREKEKDMKKRAYADKNEF